VSINIKFINRAQYYDAFSEYDLTGKVKKMEEIVYKALLNSFHKRLAYLAGKKIIRFFLKKLQWFADWLYSVN
jgi:hypothetical protein